MTNPRHAPSAANIGKQQGNVASIPQIVATGGGVSGTATTIVGGISASGGGIANDHGPTSTTVVTKQQQRLRCNCRWFCCRLPCSRCCSASFRMLSCGWNERTRLILFFVCYGVFLAPVLVALIREFYGMNLERKEEHLLLPIMHPGGPTFLLALSQWLAVLLLVYVLYRVMGRRVGIKLHEKTLAKHKDDLLRLVYFGMTMAAVGGIATRIEEGVVNTETGLSFIPLTLAYCVFFTFIFELVKERDITLSIGLFENKMGLFVVSLAFCTCVLVIAALFLTAYQVSPSFFAMYTGVFIVGLLAHITMFCPGFPGVPGRSYLHLHHWYWSVPLAHMCVFHTDVSMLAQAIFLAVHIHGVDCFGVEPLFYDTERRARHPSDFGKLKSLSIKAR
jgi:hypothetical protein